MSQWFAVACSVLLMGSGICFGRSGRAALLDFRSELSVAEPTLDQIREAVHASLIGSDRFVLLDRLSVNRLFELSGKSMPQCDGKECMVNTGRLLDVDYVIGGSLEYAYDSITFSLVLVEVESASILSQVSREFVGSISQFISEQVPAVARELVNTLSMRLDGRGTQTPSKMTAETSVLARAYGLYLTGEIDSAIVYYNNSLVQQGNGLDPYYGLMNCYFAKGLYANAVDIGIRAPGAKADPVMIQKLGYAYACLNDRDAVSRLFDTALALNKLDSTAMPQYVIKDFILAIGNGFSLARNYREAMSWFEKGMSYPENHIFVVVIERTSRALKEAVRIEATISGAPIVYAGETLLTNGSYFSAAGGLLLHNSRHLRAAVSLLSIQSRADTIGGSPVKDKPLDPQAIIPAWDLHEWELHLMYTDYYELIGNTRLQAGLRITQSSVKLTPYSLTLFVGHLTHVGALSTGAWGYYTHLRDHGVAQLSPRLGFRMKVGGAILDLEGVPHAMIAFQRGDAPLDSIADVPGHLQVSGDISASIAVPHVRVTPTLCVGPRSYLNEPEAHVFLGLSEPFRFGSKMLIEYTPFSFPFTLYYLYRFSQYDSYRSYVHLAGAFVQW